jgi:hypothetical protein
VLPWLKKSDLKLEAAERKQRKLDEAQDLTAKEEAQRKAKAEAEKI